MHLGDEPSGIVARLSFICCIEFWYTQ